MNTIPNGNEIARNLPEGRRAFWLIGLLTLLMSSGVFGQIQVDLKLNRKIYLRHEPITGKLSIINRAGRDLVFGDSNGLSWLDFTVTDSRGHLISPARDVKNAKPIVISSGQVYEQKVTINQFYPMAAKGNYHVKAVVTFPQINRVFQSKVIPVQISDGQAMWSQIVGVPQGHPKAGSYREYSLMTYYHGSRTKSLYFRLRDSDTGRVFKTYPLGDYLSVQPPVHHIDRENRLHVLHMSSPLKYTHSIVSIDGDPVSRKGYVAKGADRPELRRSDFGDVTVVGGMTAEEAAVPYEQKQFRLLSERPPGMPVLN